jgi:LDH2 family malate/lactate/ureidoglycolate dehydrogenase
MPDAPVKLTVHVRRATACQRIIFALCSPPHSATVEPEQETNLSQVFIAIDAAALGSGEEIAQIADAIVADLRTRYPGRRALDARRKYARDRIPVDDAAWDFARSCAKG